MKRTATLIIAQTLIIAILLGNDLIQLLPQQQIKQPTQTRTVTTVPTDYSTVDWTLTQDAPMSISQYSATSAPYHQTMAFTEPNIQQLCFDLTWTDDRSFFSRGLDTLTIVVTTAEGDVYTASGRSSRLTRRGEVELNITQQAIKPQSYSYPTPSTTEQEDDYVSQGTQYSSNGQQYTVIVLVTTYDRRLFKRFQDNGNDFSLQVTPFYYTPQVTRTTRMVQI
jgi:hypothetical protein